MITSTSNAQVKNLIQLNKKTKERKKQGLFIVEGIKMFQETPTELIQQIYISASFSENKTMMRLLNGKPYEVVSDTVFSYMSDTKTPQGILCTVKLFHYSLDDVLLGRSVLDRIAPGLAKSEKNAGDGHGASDPDGLWLFLENIQDPGNLGTMFRSCEGAGMAGIIMDATTADVFQPKVIRSTMGSIYRMPFYISDHIVPAVQAMKEKGITVYAAYLDGSTDYDVPDYTKASAFLIGNEGNGLSEEAVLSADARIRIPMGGKLESLNAAIAASVIMYEGQRQRRCCNRSQDN